MEILINNLNPAQDEKLQSNPKEKSGRSCLFIFLLFVFLLSIFTFLIRDYINIIPSLLQITQKVIPRSQTENNIKYQYSGKQYINFLLLGSDNDAKFTASNVLTQTMIIISINTKNGNINMISIPRDFWVKINGIGLGKIDQASGFGGLALARQTVEEDFGVHIDYYAWVGLSGFIKVIDTFGGINIDVNHPVLDDAYPNDVTGNNPYSTVRLYIPAGAQHLDGFHALEYVRSRHGDLQGDFGRSARQQQIILAVKNKMENENVVDKIPELTNELKDSIRTDISLVDITNLAPIIAKIRSGNIHRFILSPPDYASNGLSPDGKQDIVLPDYPKIQLLFNTLFANDN